MKDEDFCSILICYYIHKLSRMVSAIGVLVIADEFTSKQIKVPYARVLVEVDITKDFDIDIKVRDTGREFTQRAIPE